ncbi:MAG: hypothetical protein LBJ00_15690 [Planctomycetaceae bacterium]|nr:hypothetical protein [Planctomycetaceae bacterium]
MREAGGGSFYFRNRPKVKPFIEHYCHLFWAMPSNIKWSLKGKAYRSYWL